MKNNLQLSEFSDLLFLKIGVTLSILFTLRLKIDRINISIRATGMPSIGTKNACDGAVSGEMMKNLLDRDLRLHHTALNLQAYRQQLLASNIANADTPNFKARDIVFRDALDKAMGRSPAWEQQPLPLLKTHARHLGDKTEFTPEPFVRYRTEWQSAVDGNTVDMDMERAAFAENTVHYEASVTFINGLLRSMQTAITGQ